MCDDVLKEVPNDEIPQVLEELKKDWPTNFLLCQYIKIMKQNRKENKRIHQTLYKHGSIDNGVYIMKTSLSVDEGGSKQYFIATTSTDLSDVSKVITGSSEISLNKGQALFEINFSKFTPYVTQAVISKGQKYSMTNNIMMWFPPEDQLDVGELPKDVYLKHLEESQIPEINENWPHKQPGSDKFLAQELEINFGLGLFRKSDNKLLSSSISLHSGGIFILYTHIDHRKKGYAEIIVRNMVQEIRKRGNIPFGTILVENIPSLNLFRKIGFKEFSRVDFILI